MTVLAAVGLVLFGFVIGSVYTLNAQARARRRPSQLSFLPHGRGRRCR